MAIYAGIDPSITNTGVVLLGDSGEVLGHFNSKTVKVENKSKHNSDIHKYCEKADGILHFLNKYGGPYYAAYEDYSFGSTHRSFSLGEYGGILKSKLLLEIPEIVQAAPTLIKKFATGVGSAKKESMIAQARKESTYIDSLDAMELTDDICDAYFIAKLCYYIYNENALKNDTSKYLIRERMEVANTWKS